MTKYKAVTITKDEAVKDISKVVIAMLNDNVADLVNGVVDDSMFTGFANVGSKSIKEIVDLWSEFCSEQFFKDNKDVIDILLLEDTLPGGIAIKSWLASK